MRDISLMTWGSVAVFLQQAADIPVCNALLQDSRLPGGDISCGAPCRPLFSS